MIKDETDIVMTKWVAVKGTAFLSEKYASALAGKLPMSIIDRARGFSRYVDTEDELKTAEEFDAEAFEVSEGGIFKALWNMSEAAGIGLEIDLKQLSIKQETVEICEFFNINPYMLCGEGSLLIASPYGNAVKRELGRKGIDASVIGHVTAGNDRVVINGNDRQFISSRIQDELLKVDAVYGDIYA